MRNERAWSSTTVHVKYTVRKGPASPIETSRLSSGFFGRYTKNYTCTELLAGGRRAKAK
jgi:hypothetical protein